MENKIHYLYVVECKDHSLYTGYTTNLERRIKQHNTGKGAKYTRARRPVTLCYYEEYSDASSALKAEYAFKQKTRAQKIQYIQKYYPMRSFLETKGNF